ncbi:MAG: hypothetical protein V8T00_03380 [Oscillospiraceae bacterium]
MESEILLSAQNISHSFYLSKTASVRALDKLSFEIRRAKFTASSVSPVLENPRRRAAS